MALSRAKGRKTYMMDFWFQGRHVYESTNQKTKAAAKAVETNRRQSLEQGLSGFAKPEGPKFFEVTAAAWLEMKSATMEPNSLRIETTNLGHLNVFFAGKFTTEIRAEDIAAYQKKRAEDTHGKIKKKKYAKKTINLEIGTLRSILIYCNQWTRVQGNQRAGKVKFHQVRDNHGMALTMDQEIKLTEACSRSRSRSLVVIYLVALYTGARFGVVRRLQWRDVDFAKRCIQWGKDKTASGDYRIIPLVQRPYEALSLWAENFPDRKPDHYVFPTERVGGVGHKFGMADTGVEGFAYDTDVTKPVGSIKTAWKGAQTRAGVVCRIHDLRHTATTRMMEAGHSLHEIGDIQGWSASQLVLMVKRYSRFNTTRHRMAMESIDLIAAKEQTVAESRTEGDSLTNSLTVGGFPAGRVC
jgi:integrase